MAVRQLIRSIYRSAWIGWKVDSNWTDPTLFAIYYLLRPLSGLLIVGFIGLVVLKSGAAGSLDRSLFAYFFIGNTFFVYLVQVTSDMSILIHVDRARYEVLKNIYITPSSLRPYIAGRGIMAVIDASISVFLTFFIAYIIFSYLVPGGLGINLQAVNLPLFLAALLLGTFNWVALGFILSSVNLVSSKMQFTLEQYVAGSFYLLGGVIFPPENLPSWAKAISDLLPITYFLETIRLAFNTCSQSCLPASVSLGYLTISTVALLLLSVVLFWAAERRCRSRGLIDQKAEY